MVERDLSIYDKLIQAYAYIGIEHFKILIKISDFSHAKQCIFLLFFHIYNSYDENIKNSHILNEKVTQKEVPYDP